MVFSVWMKSSTILKVFEAEILKQVFAKLKN